MEAEQQVVEVEEQFMEVEKQIMEVDKCMENWKRQRSETPGEQPSSKTICNSSESNTTAAYLTCC